MKVYMKSSQNLYYGEGIWEDGKITVLKGSKISLKNQTKITEQVRKMREDKSIVDFEGNVLRNVIFDNPSSAGQFIMGCAVNGWTRWRTEEKKELKFWK